MSPFTSQPLVFISSVREEVSEIDWLHLTTLCPKGLAVIAGLDRESDRPCVHFQLPVIIFIHLIFSKQMWQRQGSRLSSEVGSKNRSLLPNSFCSAVYQKLMEFDIDGVLQSWFECIVLSVQCCFHQKTTVCPLGCLDVRLRAIQNDLGAKNLLWFTNVGHSLIIAVSNLC